MQDIHSIGGGGGGGRLFGGGGGDRRLRPHHHHHHHHQGHGPQALKCPRCESLNTKFCYYNNYNLSQPRHFCKSCRRYWTKGGVLRNVPVGGGCRKTKRSKPKSSSSNSDNRSSSETAVRRKSSTNSQNSSSDSSSLTANTTAVTITATAPATAAEINSTISAPTMLCFQESSTGLVNITQSSTPPNPSFDPTLLDQSSGENNNIFPEIGTFTSLIGSSTAELPLGFNTSPFRLHHSNASQQHQWMQTDDTIGEELKAPETSSLSFMELQNKTEDWNHCGTDEALFDQSYWNQTQWDDDHDHGHGHGNHQLNYLP